MSKFFERFGKYQPAPGPDTTPPTTPGGLAATVANPAVLSLATLSTDNVAVTGYQVWRKTGSGGSYSLLTTTTTWPIADATVSGGTTYYWKTRAYDAASNYSGYSNEASATIPSSSGADSVAPTVPVGLSVLSNTSSVVQIGCITPADPSVPGQVWAGLQQLNVKRTPPGSVIGTITVGPGNQPTLTLADIGPQSSTITQSGADISFTTVAKDNPYPTTDCLATAFQAITGTSWWAGCKISSFSAAAGYSNVGIYARAAMGQTAQFVGILTTPFASGNGFISKYRPTLGGNDTNLSTAVNSAGPVWLLINRNGDTYTTYYSLDGNTLVSMGSVTQTMGSTIYAGPAATTADGVSISVVAQQVFVQNLANSTLTDSSVAASTGYTYAIASQDAASNASSYSNTISVTTPGSGGGSSKKWNPGWWLDSLVFSYPGALNETTKATEIGVLRAGPANVLGYETYFTWPCFENITQGTYDFSAIDTEYTLVTGYVSGTTTSAVYSNPRRYSIYILHDDYFQNTPGRILPTYIYNSGTYGAGPGSAGNGWWTSTPGGTGCVIALWRAALAARYAALYTALGAHVLPDGYTVDTSPYVEWVKNSLETADIPQNVGGASFASADGTYSTANYLAGYATLNAACKAAFPHTNYVTPCNFIGPTGNEDVSLMNTLAAAKSGVGGPDVFGYSSGQNVTSSGGETGLTFGQAAYIGLVPPASGNPFFTAWVSGGTDMRGVIPYIATIQGTEMGYESDYDRLDLFKQANTTLKATHIAISYLTPSQSPPIPVNNQWLGNASSMSQWLTAPGTWGGVLDMIYANPVSNTAYPSAY